MEETMGGLSLWRQSFEITGKSSDLTERSVKDLVDLLRDALHHLEAGKAAIKDAEKILAYVTTQEDSWEESVSTAFNPDPDASRTVRRYKPTELAKQASEWFSKRGVKITWNDAP
jgi:hypothetical protein